jgi:hypothetical protein
MVRLPVASLAEFNRRRRSPMAQDQRTEKAADGDTFLPIGMAAADIVKRMLESGVEAARRGPPARFPCETEEAKS